MTALRGDEQMRRYLIESAADRAPADLLARTLVLTGAARQRRRWWTGETTRRPSSRTRPNALRWAALAAVLALTVVGGALLVGALPADPLPEVTPRPTTDMATEGATFLAAGAHTVTGFTPQFDYVLPDTRLGYAPTPSDRLVEWVDTDNPVQARHGVSILWVEEATVHSCTAGDRIRVRSAPEALLIDLRDVGRAGVIDITTASLDGRPAFSARISPTSLPATSGACETSDVHAGYELAYAYITLTEPAELIAAEIEGLSLLVKIWARTPEELATWLPVGRELVDSIRFKSTTPPEPTAVVGRGAVAVITPGPHTVMRFQPPFDYVMPDAVLRYGPSVADHVAEWIDTQDQIAATHGVTLFRVDDGEVHGCGDQLGRAKVRSSPDGLLVDLRDLGYVGIGSITSNSLDGRPARTARVTPIASPGAGGGCETSDLHSGGSFPYLGLTEPAELIAVEIDGVTVLVKIWARTAEDLDTWLPIGRELVDSIRFISRTP